MKTPEEKAQWDREHRNVGSITELKARLEEPGQPGLFVMRGTGGRIAPAEAERKMAGAEPVQAAVPAPRPAKEDKAVDMDVAAPGVLPPPSCGGRRRRRGRAGSGTSATAS